MRSARNAEQAFFPLDDELELLAGTLTPSLQEDLVRLGTWMPFGRAVQELQHFRQVAVSRPTAERITEAAGAAYVAFQTAEVQRIERHLPAPPPGPEKQFLSVDGALVPLVGGEWAEVKTLVIGDVQPAVMIQGEQVIHTTNLSYFSRLTDSDSFQRLALVETQRRGVETARAVAAVTDGAEWIQKFVDHHRSDAVRILDFPHAGSYLSAIGQTVLGEGSAPAQAWWEVQRHALKHSGPTTVLAAAQALVSQQPEHPELATQLAYLEKRQAQLQYPAFQAAGWPIGDGAVESGNKLVVEARLKGSGMHWARPHVDPLLALRNIVCSDRWCEAWPQITQTLRQQAQQRRAAQHAKRHPLATQPAPALAACPPPPAKSAQPPASPIPSAQPDSQAAAGALPPNLASTKPWKPPANHPWRHMPFGRARFKPPFKHTDAKS